MFQPFFEWSEGLAMSQVYRESLWLFAVTQSLHLVAIATFVGAILIVDLRLLGTGLKSWTPAELWHEARPFMIGAIVLMIATGIPLFLSEAIKCYYNNSFWVKMTTLPIAIAFAFTIRAGATTDAVRNTPRRQALIGAVSITLWLIVAAAGRWIGFS